MLIENDIRDTSSTTGREGKKNRNTKLSSSTVFFDVRFFEFIGDFWFILIPYWEEKFSESNQVIFRNAINLLNTILDQNYLYDYE